MNEDFLTKIIKAKKTCYFISPHFDDAIFSSGALISYLSKHTKVIVVNVFTKAGRKPYTLSAKRYLQICGYKDAEKLYFDREKEDKEVLKKIAVDVVNLGFPEALWREKRKKNIFTSFFKNIAEFNALYPTYRLHILGGKIASEDMDAITQIRNKLKDVVDIKNSVIFCPASFKSHIDHIVTRNACEQFKNIIYWSDELYFTKKPDEVKNFDVFSFDKNLDLKKELAQGYKTQYSSIFKDGYPIQPEIFFIKNIESENE